VFAVFVRRFQLDSINAELIVIGIGNDERMRELTPFKK
jgi:hypothetical protein